MKQPKKLTREHKQFLSRCNRNPNDYMLLSDSNVQTVYVHKLNGQRFIRDKYTGR